MPTISYTQKLVPLIEDLSQNISEIASILKAAETAEDAESKVENQKTRSMKSKNPKQSPQEVSQSAEASGTESEQPSVSVDDVRAVLAEKSQDGLTAKVRELLESFDAKKLSAVDPARLPELLEAAKALK